jgi:hypothetical protein
MEMASKIMLLIDAQSEGALSEEMRELEALLIEGGYEIKDKFPHLRVRGTTRWRARLDVKRREMRWCRFCEAYTPHKIQSPPGKRRIDRCLKCDPIPY